MLKQLISELPEVLQDAMQVRIEVIQEAVPANFPADRMPELVKVFVCSEFIRNQCSRDPQILRQFAQGNDLDTDRDGPEACQQRLVAALQGVDDLAQLSIALRDFRQYEMVRIAWRDLARLTDLNQILAELSWLAIACVRESLKLLQGWLATDYGSPQNSAGEALDMVVLGMGKLGAEELNFSSDIDLIFTFEEEGECRGPKGSLSHGEFFTRLARQFMQLFNEVRDNGFVFRVDARLRPFGDVGQLALSFDAMEAYYERHGREWERYAMIKALPIAGNPVHSADLMARLKPFVYRRYLDFGSFENLREMKALIRTEVKRKGLEQNVKLGAGGIREIEFVGQAFQLIRGGRDAELQARPIQQILTILGEMDLLPDWVVDDLQQAYCFLRDVENRLQEWADQQTHELPNDELSRFRLAWSMDFEDWDSFLKALDAHRKHVRETFERVFAAPQVDESDVQQQMDNPWQAVWLEALDQDAACDFMREQGIEDCEGLLLQLDQFRQGAVVRTLSARGRARLDALMPLILGALQRADDIQEVTRRVIGLLEATARRTAYLSLLAENPMALSQLGRLLAASPWVAGLLTRMPVLMDELLDARKLYGVLSHEALREELESRFAHLGDDVEVQMDVLRQFGQANALRVAAAEITGAMPVNRVSDQLTYVAETVLGKVFELAWGHMVERYGEPEYVLNGEKFKAGFCIVAYGKLGGLELGFSSDLDLVFLHDSQGEKQQSNGQKCVDNAVFFARLGQRIIHLLSTQTTGGKLYEVDTRLRPSGGSGLLVSSLQGFRDYQLKDAWVWEHQSLVRARPVTGSEKVAQKFQDIRQEVLTLQRDPVDLAVEVSKMRERMRGQLDRSTPDLFDLKQGVGGIADIEFMIQYLVLREAHNHQTLIVWSDNLRQIESIVEANLLSVENARMLSEAYLAYRHRSHELSLQNQKPLVDNSEFMQSRTFVSQMWQELFGSA